jgi:aminopeptidase N
MNSVTQLTQFFTPNNYKVALDIDRPNRRFQGTVEIRGDLKEASKHIQLHAKGLTVAGVTIDGTAGTSSQAENDVLLINQDTNIQAGSHLITISFSGEVTDTLHGLYPGYYNKDGQPKELLVTQFESHHAREVFPCIDEPAAKAVFELTLTTETGVMLVFVTAKELRKREDSATMKDNMQKSIANMGQLDVFRAWFERSRDDAKVNADPLIKRSLGG